MTYVRDFLNALDFYDFPSDAPLRLRYGMIDYLRSTLQVIDELRTESRFLGHRVEVDAYAPDDIYASVRYSRDKWLSRNHLSRPHPWDLKWLLPTMFEWKRFDSTDSAPSPRQLLHNQANLELTRAREMAYRGRFEEARYAAIKALDALSDLLR